jgi:hypothetical protein
VDTDKDFERRALMRKMLRVMAILAAFGLTAWIGVVALAQGSSTPSPSTSTTTSPTPSTGSEDVKGSCDEAEHASDPECVAANPVVEDDPENDDQGEDDPANDDQGEDESNDDQGEVDDDQGEDEDNDDRGEDEGNDSGPGSVNSGPGNSSSGSGS